MFKILAGHKCTGPLRLSFVEVSNQNKPIYFKLKKKLLNVVLPKYLNSLTSSYKKAAGP